MTTTREQAHQVVAALLGSHNKEKSSLISLLQDTQAAFGYLPQVALQEIADFLGVPPVQAWGVATFYNQFRFLPLGKCHIQVCMGTACHLAGGKLILEALERQLDIKVGGTTMDGNFSLERVACIGCCMLAPVAVMANKVFPRLTPFKIEEALVPYKQEAQGDKPANDESS